jgi:uncharacterized damage-inducible protein DinB
MAEEQPLLRRLQAYDAWANGEALTALVQARRVPPRAVAIMAHIIAALDLWHERWRPAGRRIEVWPATPLADCRAALDRACGDWARSLATTSAADLDHAVAYVNTRGESWSSTVSDIVLHFVAHGSYHRGQIAALLGGAGEMPAYTDYIHAARTGRLPTVSRRPD